MSCLGLWLKWLSYLKGGRETKQGVGPKEILDGIVHGRKNQASFTD